MMNVYFTKQFGKYGPGDCASFTAEEAARIAKAGAGRVVEPRELAEVSKPVRNELKPERMLGFVGGDE